MRKGDKARGILGVWGLIVVLIVVVSCFSWAAGSEEAGAYKVGDYSEQDGSLFNTTEPNEVANKSICSVTLITGDVVIVTTLPDGKRGFAIKSADPTKLGQSFQIFKIPKGTYIFPEGIDLSKVDKELFNIDYLVREEYCNLTYLPVLVDYKDKEEKVFGVAEQKELEKGVNITIVKSYRSIPTFSAKLSFEGIDETFKTLVERPEIKKIWLDKKVKVSLYESVPLIGAPELWESGYKGSGLEIAILDTGIDDTHPDLDDLDDNPATFDPKVIVKEDFTDDISTEDLYGHGTHCAGIAAGTGAAPSEPYPIPTPVPTPTVTPTPPSSSELSTPVHLHAAKNIEQKVKREVYRSEATSPDAYEPDDNYWLANWIPTNETKQLHHFHVPGDLDYVKFNATENTQYLIETSDLGNESDTYMYLYDTDGLTEITHDDDSGEGLASRIIWGCDTSGTYYVKVRHFSSSASGPNTRYNISVLEGYTPPAEFNDVYSDYGEDTDGDGLYDYLVVNVGVNVTDAGNYRVSGSLYENGTYNSVDYDSNTIYLCEGNQTVQLRFDAWKITKSGTFDLKYLYLYNSSAGVRLDYRYYAHTTGYYEPLPRPALFNDVYSDYGEDTDGDGLNNSLIIEVGVNVTKAGTYRVRGELYENATYHYIISAYNTTYLDTGNHSLLLEFDGIRLRQNKYNGTYDLKYLYLYNYSYPVPPPTPAPTPVPASQLEKSEAIEVENVSVLYGEQLDYRYYAYTTGYYEWSGWQKPPAEFNDVYFDYAEDTDVPPDGLNNSLVINVGVNVTEAGDYRVSGELYENGTYNYVDYAYNTTYLNPGNQTIPLRFEGIKIRQNEYNGTYDLKYLGLYDATYPYPVPEGGGGASPIPISERELEEKIESGEISPEKGLAMYGEQLDYRYYAYTTSYYSWTEFQKPPAEFTGNFNDYGEDSDGDGLYDYLIIEAEINVTKGGEFEFWDDLYYYNETTGYWEYGVDCHKHNYSYLDLGVHNLTIKLDGMEIRKLEYNGTFKMRLYLDGRLNSKWVKIDEAEYYTKTYNWTEFQRPPAEFNDVYSDYGEDTDGDGLYDFLVIEVGMNVTKAGRYRVWGELYENGTYHWVDYATKSTYLCEGNQTIQLKYSGIEIRDNGYNGTYDLKYLGLYSEWKEDDYKYWKEIDYRYYAYTTGYYNYTDFQEFPRYIGVAPGAYLWNVKVLNQYGWGYESWIIDGIEYAAYGPDETANTGDEADIISMSLGGAPTDGTDPLSQAVNDAVDQGLVVAVAAGNAWDYFTIGTPGAAEKVITVGASDKEDVLAYFSSKGPTLDLRVKPDIVAPGVDIIAPRASGTSMGYPYNDYYMEASGTSMATPHVAGAAALILQVHPDWTPEEVKNALISTADDLGYNVYQQGGGRIYVPSAANPKILVNPATTNFKNLDTTSGTITFKNLDTVQRTLTLDVTVKEVFNDTEVDCAHLNRTLLSIAPGSSASVLLTINDTSLPHSLYSGKVSATYSGGEVHAIFGFSNLNKVTVDKINMEGEPAVAELVVIFSDTEDALIEDAWTDETGTAVFYLLDGVYLVISGWGDIPGASVYTIAENVSVEGNTSIALDERNTKVIDFDYNKSGQIMSERSDDVYYAGEYVWIGFGSLWDYTNETVTYITPTNSFKSVFIYSYYPEEYYNESDRWLINAPEWHKLLYNLSGVTENVTFVADYDKLAERTTDYKVALKPELASWYYFAWHPDMWFSITTVYKMSAPLSRIEWLSPEPIEYFGGYEQYAEWWNETYPCWSYRILEKYYPAGSEPYFAVAEHPFKSGAEIDIPWEGTLDIYGTISEDTFGNSFANTSRLASYIFGNITYLSGNITVMADGEVIVDQEDIWDFFWGSVYFYGTPKFTVIIQGNSSPGLSTYTRTELNFIADPTRDYQPPGITMRVFGGYSTTTSILTATLPSGRGGGGGGGAPPSSPSALYNIIPGGEVNVEMNIEDESNITHLMLEYSVNNGTTWNEPVNIMQIDGNNWIANLGSLEDVYVSLRVNATDFRGNNVSQTVIKGFYVSEKREAIFDTGAPANPYPSISGTHNGTITPNQTINISKLYTYPCLGTGGHTESIKLYENNILIANGTWNGYVSDWHNITIHNVTTGAPYIMLLKEHGYNYTLRTGSYPQIIHAKSKDAIAGAGTIKCDKFIDANGKEYTNWIPAIKLFL